MPLCSFPVLFPTNEFCYHFDVGVKVSQLTQGHMTLSMPMLSLACTTRSKFDKAVFFTNMIILTHVRVFIPWNNSLQKLVNFKPLILMKMK